MDRIIVYPGAIPLDTDMLNTNRNTMTALHALISATLGTATAVDGLTVSATTPASMSVTVAPGSITQFAPMDGTAYGSLGADTADGVMKMGTMVAPVTLGLSAPGTAGTSVSYLLEAAFSETDQNPVVLPYYNVANPAAPYLGPGNSGIAQSTMRQQRVTLLLKAGAAAPTGSQVVPPIDPGWTGLAAIVINSGATQVNPGDIAMAPQPRFTGWKLPDLRPGFAFAAAYSSSGSFIVPAGVTRLRLTVIGGGGAGGTHASLPGGGGGAGGRGEHWLAGIVPGAVVPVAVGAPGMPTGGPGAGGPGGSSGFGIYVAAAGGQGGGGGGSGAAVYYFGGYGTDAIPVTGRGGDGAGPGSGKGGSSGATGANANGFGGGGGSSAAAGGAGGGGLVIVEY